MLFISMSRHSFPFLIAGGQRPPDLGQLILDARAALFPDGVAGPAIWQFVARFALLMRANH
jgi:hypothetical protein